MAIEVYTRNTQIQSLEGRTMAWRERIEVKPKGRGSNMVDKNTVYS